MFTLKLLLKTIRKIKIMIFERDLNEILTIKF